MLRHCPDESGRNAGSEWSDPDICILTRLVRMRQPEEWTAGHN